MPIANYNTSILVRDSMIVGDYTRTRGSSILTDPISPSRLPRPPYFKTTLLILIPVACITLHIVRTFSPEGLRETHRRVLGEIGGLGLHRRRKEYVTFFVVLFLHHSTIPRATISFFMPYNLIPFLAASTHGAGRSRGRT
ncbi:hypothetical protein B0H13DRAFT_2352009 [Mycena leptocephala]|nr:hypothetical protein B0H13DRAFT_2352009 [Mycena leptocephala]